jgi:hypothetical protein
MKTTQLIGVGLVDAKAASDLVQGDVTVWNYGGVYRVLSVEALSPKFVRVNMVSINPATLQDEDKPVWARRANRDFAIGFSARMTDKLAAKVAA